MLIAIFDHAFSLLLKTKSVKAHIFKKYHSLLLLSQLLRNSDHSPSSINILTSALLPLLMLLLLSFLRSSIWMILLVPWLQSSWTFTLPQKGSFMLFQPFILLVLTETLAWTITSPNFSYQYSLFFFLFLLVTQLPAVPSPTYDLQPTSSTALSFSISILYFPLLQAWISESIIYKDDSTALPLLHSLYSPDKIQTLFKPKSTSIICLFFCNWTRLEKNIVTGFTSNL